MIETLKRIAKLKKLNYWMFKQISPYIGERILEVGCGIGTFTDLLILYPKLKKLVSIDIEKKYIQNLFFHYGNPKFECFVMDASSNDLLNLKPYNFDTIICLNVLEHIKNDISVLENFYTLLPEGGHILLLVPSYPFLFGSLDISLGHYRRYKRKSLESILYKIGFNMVQIFYVNFVGIPGWFLNSRILKNKINQKVNLNSMKNYYLFSNVLTKS